ncbi:hypothetical protein LTR09_009321 [Extremus antarcticus]|uniref:Uncharacterized protein n=1 Tax=Extremus antarcticus TaxID=702011 RepID=A0AAJ0DFU0_9PEZI|nr:hypothetical protein LTR09_009321 [Extremus antarcticus]
MHLLQSPELCFDDDANQLDAHVRGAVRCIVARGPAFCSSEFERAMFYATYAAAATQQHLSHLTEALDTVEWRTVDKAPSCFSSTLYQCDVMECRRRIMTMVPRLTGLVRQLKFDPTDQRLVQAVTESMSEVISIDRVNGKCAIPSEAHSGPSQPTDVLPATLFYPDPADPLVHSYHWSLSIAIIGLIQQVSSCGVTIPSSPPLEELYREEYQCAILIYMSLPQLSTANKMIAAASLFPLQMAWAALSRVVSRGEQKTVGCTLDWLVDRIVRTAEVSGHGLTRFGLTRFAETAEGSLASRTARACNVQRRLDLGSQFLEDYLHVNI